MSYFMRLPVPILSGMKTGIKLERNLGMHGQ
jgi:hypothetical protein